MTVSAVDVDPLVIGPAECDPSDGAPLRFRHPDRPDLPYLLDEASDEWHTAQHRWGSGFVMTNGGSGRWNQPAEHRRVADGVRLGFEPVGGLGLEVVRRGTYPGADGAAVTLTEEYRWTNGSTDPVELGSLGIALPIRDLYVGAGDALRAACHAHVFTGGAWAWVLAEPMSGDGPLLGLVVRTGALWAYSVESRNIRTSSNVRGHLVVHPTDRARNPDAFGGQPELSLRPGESYALAWTVGFYADRAEFLADTNAPVELPELSATLDRDVRVRPRPGVRVESPQADVEAAEQHHAETGGPGVLVRGRDHGAAYLEIRNPDGDLSRTALAFHQPLRTLVERRIGVLLASHRPRELPEPDRYAFVPRDTATGLTQPTSGWPDWSDGAERLGMPSLLQQARLRGWGDPAEIDPALHGWAAFARARLLDADGTVRRDASEPEETPRLYNFPWMAHFFAEQHRLFGDAEPDGSMDRDFERGGPKGHLETAAAVLERSYALGAADHLSIGQPEAVLLVADLLRDAGQADRADALIERLRSSARHFAAVGADLPAHEVNYEQSMVAPLVSLLALVKRRWPEPVLDDALRRAVRWMRAFGGPQPHARLRDIGIRHWDGFWFGRNRQWGDVFPHYWSVLTAVALTQLPDGRRDADTDRTAEGIFRANTLNFSGDGEGSCAFVLPSCVDGVPGYRADPLSNDQDWALTLWLRAI